MIFVHCSKFTHSIGQNRRQSLITDFLRTFFSELIHIDVHSQLSHTECISQTGITKINVFLCLNTLITYGLRVMRHSRM